MRSGRPASSRHFQVHSLHRLTCMRPEHCKPLTAAVPGSTWRRGGVGILLSSFILLSALAGCTDRIPPCEDLGNIEIAVLSAGGERVTEASWEVGLSAGSDVTVKATMPECPDGHPPFHWHLGPDIGSGIGFEPQHLDGHEDTKTITIPYPGKYTIGVDFGSMDTSAYSSDYKPHPAQFWNAYGAQVTASAWLVVDEPMPADGSLYTFDFTTFCCPKTTIHVAETQDGLESSRWIKRIVVKETDAVVWEGDAICLNEPYKELGDDWFEELRIEIEPQSDVPVPEPLRGEYRARIGIGDLDAEGTGWC